MQEQESPTMQTVRGDGVDIQLAVWHGHEKTIFCVHGLTGNCRFWDAPARALALRHNVVAMDLRGRGLSGKPRWGYSVEHHCRDIRSVLNVLGLRRVVLVGHSLGAVISLAYAAKFTGQVESLILVDGGGKLSKAQSTKVFAGIKPSLDRLGRTFSSLDEYVNHMRSVPFLQPWSSDMETSFRYDVEEVEGGVRSRIHRAHIYQEIVNLEKTSFLSLYPKIACPTLILRATEGMLAHDDILLPENSVHLMLKQIQEARCVDVEGANHYTILLRPNEVRDQTIGDFIE